MLDKASPVEIRDTELRFHLMNALPEKVSFQLKLLPKEDYLKTLSKARELLLIYRRADSTAAVSQMRVDADEGRFNRLEKAVEQVSQQLAALGTRRRETTTNRWCFKCGRTGHLSRNCRSRGTQEIQCFNLGGKRTHRTEMLAPGKRPGEHSDTSRGCSQSQMNARTTENIPAFPEAKGSTRAAYAHGKVNEQCVEMLLDSGASCSVVNKNYVSPRDMDTVGLVKLLNADGRSLTPVGTTSLKVNLGNLTAHQTFIVVEHLSAPVILGCDFLTKQGLVMDFEQGTFHSKESPDRGGRLKLQTNNVHAGT